MKKHKILLSVILLIVFSISILFTNMHKINEQILIWIDRRLDYERSLKVGDEFNKVVWGDFTFQINHYKTGNKLDYVNNGAKTSLLDSVIKYKISNDKLYVIASEGYAVVDSNNIAKIYVTSKGGITFDNIIYLLSFEEFEDEEQDVFNDLK